MATNSPTRKDKSGRGRKVTKFALAGVAVLGVGAALTSAAWTDNVWFGAAASAGSVDLVGSTDRGNNWHQGNDSGASIPVDPTAFANMAPLESRVVTLSLRNNGSVPLELDDALPSGTGPLFGGNANDDLDVDVQSLDGAIIAPNAVVEFTVTVTAPDWGNNDQGKTGALLVQVGAHT